MILPDFGFHCFFPFVLPINLFLTRAVKCTVVNNKKQKKQQQQLQQQRNKGGNRMHLVP